MNVPSDLQEIIGKRELRYSLKTGYIGQAKHKAHYLASQVHIMFGYGKRFEPKILFDKVISKTDYPIDLRKKQNIGQT